MQSLPIWAPWALFGVAGLAVILYVVYFFWLAPEEDEEEEPSGDTTQPIDHESTLVLEAQSAEHRARKSRMIALKASLERSLDRSMETREGPRVAPVNRMAMPWFMIVGADGSGRSTTLGNTGLPLPFGPPIEVDSSKKNAGRWWLFEDAVVLEAPAAAPATDLKEGEKAPDTSAAWNNLLHLLRRERPDSPLNGVVVTVSCADLVGSRRRTPEQLGEQAAKIREFLERTRNVLDIRLPVHLLVTKCDSVPGFRSFAESMPPERRHDAFGWANPQPVETPFSPGWVDSAFGEMRQTMADLHDELIAAPDRVNDAEGLFIFVNEFAELEEPLREFVEKLMPEGERRPSQFLRGIYFTGDMNDHGPRKSAETTLSDATMQMSAEVALSDYVMGARDGGVGRRLVFLRQLFADRIFREAGLARPAARLRLSRDRRVIAAQAAALIFAMAGGVGLWTTVSGLTWGDQVYRTGLRTDAQAMTLALSGLAIDLDELNRSYGAPNAEMDALMARRLEDAAVTQFVAAMRDVSSTKIRSAFVPTSWMSPVPRRVRHSMDRGFRDIVMRVSRTRLEERANLLLAAGAVVGPVAAADPKTLEQFVADLRELGSNIERYNTIATGNAAGLHELALLLDYLFGERPLGADTGRVSREFRAAVHGASAPTFALTPEQANLVLARSVSHVRSITDAATRQLLGAGGSGHDDFAALRRLHAMVQFSHPQTGLVASVTDSAILGVPLAKLIQDSISARLATVATRVMGTSGPADVMAARLGLALEDLFALRFTELSEGRQVTADLRAGEHLAWDVGSLELGLRFRGEQQTAIYAAADHFSAIPRERLLRAFEAQLAARVADVVADAQRFVPVEGETVDPLSALRADAASLDAATGRIVRLAALLDSLGSGDQGRRLLASGARQAERVLMLAQVMYDRSRYFAPDAERIASWRGGVPLSLPAVGAADSNAYDPTLSRAMDGTRALAQTVAPALLYLRREGAEQTRTPRLLEHWSDVGTAIQLFDAQDPASTLGTLIRYILVDLSVVDQAGCQNLAARPVTASATDPFGRRLLEFHSAVVARCGPSGAAEELAAYRRMGAFFMGRLSGRFPFTEPGVPGMGDASPADIQEFLRAYDAFAAVGETALRSDPRVRQTGQDAFTFLDRMREVRAFMAPLMGGDAGGRPGYVVRLGEDTAPRAWRYGERIAGAAGSWGALRYAVENRDSVAAKFYHPETGVELVVPVFPVVAAEIR